MEALIKWIPLIIPLILIQFGLMIGALINLAKRKTIKGKKWVWAIIIIVIGIVGPVIYFVIGRDEV